MLLGRGASLLTFTWPSAAGSAVNRPQDEFVLTPSQCLGFYLEPSPAPRLLMFHTCPADLAERRLLSRAAEARPVCPVWGEQSRTICWTAEGGQVLITQEDDTLDEGGGEIFSEFPAERKQESVGVTQQTSEWHLQNCVRTSQWPCLTVGVTAASLRNCSLLQQTTHRSVYCRSASSLCPCRTHSVWFCLFTWS